jgi:hypothetical protein
LILSIRPNQVKLNKACLCAAVAARSVPCQPQSEVVTMPTRKVSLLFHCSATEVIKTQTFYRLRICQDGQGSYNMSFTHTGQFQLIDYEEVELEIAGVTLVRRR